MQLTKTTIRDPEEWNDLLASDLDGHLLQSWEWGQFKERYGWQASYLSWSEAENQPKAMALILKRTIASRFSVLYCPRGPILDWSDERLASFILRDLSNHAKSENAIFIKIDPHLNLGTLQEEPPDSSSAQVATLITQQLGNSGWLPSAEQIQFRNTVVLDLSGSEEELLRDMKQKTRYNIRLATRKGVRVRKGGIEDLELLYKMYAETALRDGFTIREPAYYHDAWGTFIKARIAQPLLAEVDGLPIAGIIVFHFGSIATYMYGMSRALHREKMPNHALQWEAIKWAKSMGCKYYDFWGAPDHLEEADPMWGVYRFKRGFGAELLRLIGAWDFPSRPTFYKLYNGLLPRILSVMRLRGQAQTRQSLDSHP